MPRFFIDFPCTSGDEPQVDGENGAHIVRSLRMWEEEALTLCNGRGTDYRYALLQIEPNRTQVCVLERTESISEPSVFTTVHQSSPKADKMGSVVRKVVECGTCRVIPVFSARCVSRLDEEAIRRKAGHWQKVAPKAAKQFGREVMSKIAKTMPYAEAVEQVAADGDRLLSFYEGGGQSLHSLGLGNKEWISLSIGPEDGFTRDEVELIRQNDAQVAAPGLRIFRTETAPVAALSVLVILTGNMKQNAVWEERAWNSAKQF